ncbi:MAG: glycosyltransferase family 9 protein [Candidatus ainarchaeum sp.]|nr:glycosyltransferase family 9 protein [Candidatus ainarchaeum sp.]
MINKKSFTLATSVQNEVKKGIGQALSAYLNMPPEKRQQLEESNVNFSDIVFESLIPILTRSEVSNVLILMNEGIGNMVMLTPAIKLLKHIHPLLKITVWGKHPAIEVIEGWELVDEVVTGPHDMFYDLCFVSIWGNQLFQEQKQWVQTHCKHTLSTSLKMFHESIQHLQIAEFLGGVGDLSYPHCELPPKSLIDCVLDPWIKNRGKYIVFGDTLLRGYGWENKRWPHYVELAKLIYKKFPEYTIVLIGDEKDRKEAGEKDWPENVNMELMGKTDVKGTAYLIKHAEFYVGNDTGPTHIAAAVGTKTYAIFGPTMVAKNKPLGPNVTILNKKLPCSPCQYTERFTTCECIAYMTAEEVYNEVFFKEKNKRKTVTILVGDFSGGALRNEKYIKKVLEKELKHRVIPFDYRASLNKSNNQVEATYDLINTVLHQEPDYVFINGGQTIVPEVLNMLEFLCPNTKLINWYVDQRGQVEQWFKRLSSSCHYTFWSTGYPKMLSQVFSQTYRPCEFLPITPDDNSYFPLEVEKDIDVLFVGTPHSKPRIELLEYLVDNGVKLKIFGNGDWPDKLKPYTEKGVFDEKFNEVLNRAKMVLGINIINEVPLYFSDRYFYPMAVKTVGLNKKVPMIETMFENNRHMVFFNDPQECLDKIELLLENEQLRKHVAENGYQLYKEKYTLTKMLKQMFNSVEEK